MKKGSCVDFFEFMFILYFVFKFQKGLNLSNFTRLRYWSRRRNQFKINQPEKTKDSSLERIGSSKQPPRNKNLIKISYKSKLNPQYRSVRSRDRNSLHIRRTSNRTAVHLRMHQKAVMWPNRKQSHKCGTISSIIEVPNTITGQQPNG